MNFRTLTLMLILGACSPAIAQLTTLIESVEASTSVMNVPTTPNGRLAFKPCSQRCDAEYIAARLTPETRFVVQGEAVDFLGFRQSFFDLRRTAEGYALVSFDTERNTVTSVEITF